MAELISHNSDGDDDDSAESVDPGTTTYDSAIIYPFSKNLKDGSIKEWHLPVPQDMFPPEGTGPPIVTDLQEASNTITSQLTKGDPLPPWAIDLTNISILLHQVGEPVNKWAKFSYFNYPSAAFDDPVATGPAAITLPNPIPIEENKFRLLQFSTLAIVYSSTIFYQIGYDQIGEDNTFKLDNEITQYF